MSKKEAPEGTQAVIRAIGLLKTFTRVRSDLSLAELSAAAGLARTTTHRLLTALESEGLVARNPVTRSFRLGPAILSLGTLALISNDLRTVVEPELGLLAERSRETATLEVPLEGQMVILAEVSGSHLVTVAAEIGTRWPIHATSSGRAFLSALSADERRALLTPPLTRFTPSTMIDIDELEREFEEIPIQGFATAIEEVEAGASATAAVLRNAIGNPVGAISLSGPTSRLTRQRLSVLGRDLALAAARLAPRIHTLD